MRVMTDNAGCILADDVFGVFLEAAALVAHDARGTMALEAGGIFGRAVRPVGSFVTPFQQAGLG